MTEDFTGDVTGDFDLRNQKTRGEAAHIARLSEWLPPLPQGLIGIGDDCAAIPVDAQQKAFFLLTCDSAVSGVHFLPDITPWWSVGWRLATANVSDVVACAGQPEGALISVGAPAPLQAERLDAFYQGFAAAAAHYQFAVLGGNMSQSAHWFFDCTMLGRTDKFVSRSGACAGDCIAVSGALGDAELGRQLYAAQARTDSHSEKARQPEPPSDHKPLSQAPASETEAAQQLLNTYLKPQAALDQVETIKRIAHAAIDISDGLSSELEQISQCSKVRIDIERSALPSSAAMRQWCAAHQQADLPYLLGGGEGYQVLISLAEAHRTTAEAAGFVIIGRASPGHGVWMDGQTLPAQGWNHF